MNTCSVSVQPSKQSNIEYSLETRGPGRAFRDTEVFAKN